MVCVFGDSGGGWAVPAELGFAIGASLFSMRGKMGGGYASAAPAGDLGEGAGGMHFFPGAPATTPGRGQIQRRRRTLSSALSALGRGPTSPRRVDRASHPRACTVRGAEGLAQGAISLQGGWRGGGGKGYASRRRRRASPLGRGVCCIGSERSSSIPTPQLLRIQLLKQQPRSRVSRLTENSQHSHTARSCAYQ